MAGGGALALIWALQMAYPSVYQRAPSGPVVIEYGTPLAEFGNGKNAITPAVVTLPK
jgi:hypothetical protein